jgi:hypothetical protein
MSVAGILASSLFSSVGSHIAQKTPAVSSATTDVFKSDLQQKLAAQGSGTTASLPAQVTQLGQDLSSGNLPAAKGDFNNMVLAFTNGSASPMHSQSRPTSINGSTSQSGQSQTDPMTAALQAYSALQQNPVNSALNSSLIAIPNTFTVQA